jgi:hypothetical protein
LTTQPVTPRLKYANWIVSLFLFLLGTRVLLIMAAYAMNSEIPRPQKPLGMLGQVVGSILFIAAGIGVFEWGNWGRRLAIVMCALNVFGTVFSIPAASPGIRVRLVFALVLLLLVLVWFFLPEVRAKFMPNDENSRAGSNGA